MPLFKYAGPQWRTYTKLVGKLVVAKKQSTKAASLCDINIISGITLKHVIWRNMETVCLPHVVSACMQSISKSAYWYLYSAQRAAPWFAKGSTCSYEEFALQVTQSNGCHILLICHTISTSVDLTWGLSVMMSHINI